MSSSELDQQDVNKRSVYFMSKQSYFRVISVRYLQHIGPIVKKVESWSKHLSLLRTTEGLVTFVLVLFFCIIKRLRWSKGSVLAFGTQIRGFKPGRSRWIFQGEKILSTPPFVREVKPFVPCHTFTECKRSLNVTWKSGIFRQNSSAISRPSSSSFHYQGLWWRHLTVQVGTTKDQGLYIKP